MQRVSLVLLFVGSIFAVQVVFPSFDASNMDKFKFNLNAPQYNSPPNGALTLTLSQGNDAGTVFLLDPITLGGTATFSAAFAFIIDQGYGNDQTGVGADGIVFVVTTASNSGGSYGGGIGYSGITNSVGIEFDTWYNPENGDINGNHVGIDVGGNIRSIQQTSAPDLFNSGGQYYVWVDYDGTTLEVRYSTSTTRPTNAFLSRPINLATTLGGSGTSTLNAFVGFSAATGGSYNRHRIINFAFNDHYEPYVAPVAASTCGNNVVESGEQCDGGACCTSTCTFATSAVTCRAANGDCDVAETCSGSASTCPTDSFHDATTTCRAANGLCDVAEKCTGSSGACPADGFASAGTSCRSINGPCDVAESCTGSSAACPADAFAPATQTCGTVAAGDTCSIAAKCTGSGSVCPANSRVDSAYCFCQQKGTEPKNFPDYFCKDKTHFYQCVYGAFAPQSALMSCAGGLDCGCPDGTECGCGGNRSPCTWAGQTLDDCPAHP